MNNAKARASARYDAKNTKRISLKFNLKTDADILKKLYDVPNTQGYIKELIRKDLANNGKERIGINEI